jgi:hypothetical protein
VTQSSPETLPLTGTLESQRDEAGWTVTFLEKSLKFCRSLRLGGWWSSDSFDVAPFGEPLITTLYAEGV